MSSCGKFRWMFVGLIALLLALGTAVTSLTPNLGARTAAAQETNDDCDVTTDASCNNQDLHMENEGLRLDQGTDLRWGNGCMSIDALKAAVNIEMQDSGDDLPEFTDRGGCLVTIDSSGHPFAFTCETGVLCTADRGPKNVAIVGDGTRYEWAEDISFYDEAVFADKCSYLEHEYAYAELMNDEILAFADHFDSCDGVDVNEETGAVSLDDVAGGTSRTTDTGDGDVRNDATTDDADDERNPPTTDPADGGETEQVRALSVARLVPNKDERPFVRCNGNPAEDGEVCEARDGAGNKVMVTVKHPGDGFIIDVWSGYVAPNTCEMTVDGGTGTLSCPKGTLLAGIDTWTVKTT